MICRRGRVSRLAASDAYRSGFCHPKTPKWVRPLQAQEGLAQKRVCPFSAEIAEAKALTRFREPPKEAPHRTASVSEQSQ